ncbi:MAG: TM0106 family RecB-like putative nuclease [Chthoniobacterales bacterium]|nr:TM0106 family RecB-like putative nuclease [Chthoniobacterales bacterium]
MENPEAVRPDAESEDQKLITQTGDRHEAAVLLDFKVTGSELVEIAKADEVEAYAKTIAAIEAKIPIIFQAALIKGQFAGFADFLILNPSGKYQVWDAKLACHPKPYYAIQLCCYSEMLAATTFEALPEAIGVILGNNDRVVFRVEDFIHYYRHIKSSFLAMQDRFTGRIEDAPEPLPRAEHGRWSSRAEQYFVAKDHLVRVAGISVGQIKKLKVANVTTMTALAGSAEMVVPKLDPESLKKLVAQAQLQVKTQEARKSDPNAAPFFEVLGHPAAADQHLGLAALPAAQWADVIFDMEGYPLTLGGLEYLFGTVAKESAESESIFRDWWAHNREEEKRALEGFIDWVFDRWKKHPQLHIYHYAPYEVCAVRRLSTRHDTRQEEVDELLRNEVFVDLYQIVRHGLRVGEDGYSIKKIESLYRKKRATDVASGVDSMVHYARWIASGEPRDWNNSELLKKIRDYNEDDCRSTLELVDWLRKVAQEKGIAPNAPRTRAAEAPAKVVSPDIAERQRLAAQLRKIGDPVSVTLGDVIDFHRREQKPMWWRMFDRAAATHEDLRDDPGCIEGLRADGIPVVVKRSVVQRYGFDPSQEIKLAAGNSAMFTHNLDAGFEIVEIDNDAGKLALKISARALKEKCDDVFPASGSILHNEYVSPAGIPIALSDIASEHLAGALPASISALLNRVPPSQPLQTAGETSIDATNRIANLMVGGCLVIQGPPGTGKTYTAARAIASLLKAGKKIGIASNSHKVVMNLMCACGDALRENGDRLRGIKVRGEDSGSLYIDNPDVAYVKDAGAALAAYSGGVVGGTAWLFSRPEWKNVLDFLVIDEAGQVPLANAVAMARSAGNLILLGDQMQLEQPVQGSHPGDAGISGLQFALKNRSESKVDAPVFHAVVPSDLGLFLGESRRMHPDVCCFISESIYEGGLRSLPDCANQRITAPAANGALVTKECGIVFSPITHDGNVQQSPEEVERVKAIYTEVLGREYTASDQSTRPLELADFLFIAPYNAQVRALQAALPEGARVGSVDKFQGQEAPVCILSICSSYGEYGSRGLAFILNRSRINVAISRAKCLAIVVADPRIASSPAGSIAEMMLLNLFCKIVA